MGLTGLLKTVAMVPNTYLLVQIKKMQNFLAYYMPFFLWKKQNKTKKKKKQKKKKQKKKKKDSHYIWKINRDVSENFSMENGDLK